MEPCVIEFHWFLRFIQTRTMEPCVIEFHWFLGFIQPWTMEPCVIEFHWFLGFIKPWTMDWVPLISKFHSTMNDGTECNWVALISSSHSTTNDGTVCDWIHWFLGFIQPWIMETSNQFALNLGVSQWRMMNLYVFSYIKLSRATCMFHTCLNWRTASHLWLQCCQYCTVT